MRTLEKSIITLSLIVLNNILAFAINAVLARIMPTLEFGKLQTAYGFTTLIFNLINLGIVFATSKHVLQEKSRNKDFTSYIYNGLVIMLFVSAVFLTSFFIFLEPIINVLGFNIELIGVIQLSLLLVLFNLIYFYFTMMLISTGNALEQSFMDFANILLYAFAVLTVFIFGGLLVDNVIISRLISFIIPSIVAGFLFFYRKRLKISRKKITDILKTTKLSFMTFLTLIALNYLTKPVMGLISFEQVAYYSIAMNYGQILLILQSGVRTILFSIIGGMAARNNIKKIEKGLQILFDFVLKIVMPLSFILIFFANDVIVLIYTDKYLFSVSLAIPIIIGALINTLTINDSAIFCGLDRLKEFNKYNLVKAVIYLPVLLTLILLFSAWGASLSYLALSIISLVAFIYYLKRFKIRIKIKKPLTLALPLSILLLFFITNNSIISGLLVLIYTPLAFKLRIVSEETREQAIKALKSRKLNIIARLIS